MGQILPTYKQAIIDEITNSISGNTSQFYAFAANPVEYSNGVPTIDTTDFEMNYDFTHNIIFGKKLKTTDIYPVIEKNVWDSNTVYDRYDNQSNTLYTNNNFYVISEPYVVGGKYNIYKCIDNNDGAESTVDPGTIGTPTQATTFSTADGYKWRYVATVTSVIHDKFATTAYMPIYANNILAAGAGQYAGIEVIKVANAGSGYDAYANGTIQGLVNTTVIQLESSASSDNFFYNNNAIYIYNVSLGTSQILGVTSYISNSTGKWIYLDEACNTDIVLAGQSNYIISPKVVFDTNGNTDPIAYSVVNASSNSIDSIVILDIGSYITRANVWLETTYGSGANLVPIISYPGGHGSNPVAELNVKGMSIAFGFSNTETNTILTGNVSFNKIGILKNPYGMDSDGDKTTRFSSNTFSQVSKMTLSPSHTFNQGEVVIGVTSGAKGYVAFANSSKVYLTGDKNFIDGEYVGNSSVSSVTQITINELGNIYQDDITPLYVQNINSVIRSNTQNEFFKIIIQL